MKWSRREEKPVCDCCGYAAKLKEYPGPVTGESLIGTGKSMFCHVCAATFLSHPVTYPQLYGENRHLFASLGWIANEILEHIVYGVFALVIVVVLIGVAIAQK